MTYTYFYDKNDDGKSLYSTTNHIKHDVGSIIELCVKNRTPEIYDVEEFNIKVRILDVQYKYNKTYAHNVSDNLTVLYIVEILDK